ncbi:MAG: hypothetical protein AAGA48_28980 [Myxococcota bacterium]
MTLRQTRLPIAPVLLVGVMSLGPTCDPLDNDPFVYSSADEPRLYIDHQPLNPAVGDQITFALDTEGFATTSSVTIDLIVPGPGAVVKTCTLSTAGDCSVTEIGSSKGAGFYNATVVGTNAAGAMVTVTSGHGFLFEVGRPDNDPLTDSFAVFPLRVPVVDDGMLEVVLAHDPGRPVGYDENTAIADLETILYDYLFEDPIYRWRSTQVAFWYARRPAFTRPYNEGWDTRCGQKPFPDKLHAGALPDGLEQYEVLGVIHRNGGPGGVSDPIDGPTSSYRDCAGVVAGPDPLGSFSAHGQRPLTFMHELGHAGYELSDEYTEEESTRRVNPGLPPHPPLSCCCCNTPEPSTGFPSLGTLSCVGEATGGGFCPPDAPPCAIPGFPGSAFVGDPECYETPQASCPPVIAGSCLDEFGTIVLPTGDPIRNAFASLAECTANLTAALAFPGQEIDPTIPATMCRPLCGPSTDATCPCGTTTDEVWIVDRNPIPLLAGGVTSPTDDVMGVGGTSTSGHGWTDEHCMDVRNCLNWELARGRTQAQAESHCLP